MVAQHKLKSIDVRLLEDVFEMHGGYVLDFTNPTFAEFFGEELGVSIYDSAFASSGNSKANRLRCYLRQASTYQILQTLQALWEYRETTRRRAGDAESIPEAKTEFFQLIENLGGKAPEEVISKAEPQDQAQKYSNLSDAVAADLFNKLMDVSALEPVPRGYAFEKFLKEVFDENGMEGRAPFRVVGEQIDGSFEMSGETYLLEAKWTSKKIDAADLRSFNAKVEDKAAWSRGLFISDSGFTEEGLIAFGKGKRLVCMDGLDICEMLQQKLSLQEVLSKKVRRAAETGKPFVRLRDLM